MDLGNGLDLDPDVVGAAPQREAERVRAIGERHGMRFFDAFPQATDKHISNTPDEEEYRHQREVYAGWIDFAAEVGLDGITLSPGKYWPGLDAETAFRARPRPARAARRTCSRARGPAPDRAARGECDLEPRTGTAHVGGGPGCRSRWITRTLCSTG